MAKFEKILDSIMRFLMAISMFSLVVGGFWQIFTRWILRNPSTVTEEFMRYMLIWASMLGSAYCFYKDKHLTLDLFSSKAKGAARVIVNVFIEAVILFFVIYVFIYGGIHLMVSSINKSPVMQISYKILYFILPFSGIFIVIARVLKYVQLICEKKDKDVA